MRILLQVVACVGALAGLLQSADAAPASKFYRVAEVDGVWWFVAPDGSCFFSSGVNVVDVGGTRETYQPERPQYAAFRHYPTTAAWVDATHQRLAQWGFNTVGGWSNAEMTRGPLPYTAVLHLGKELGVPWNDLFHPQFAQQIAAAVARDVRPRVSDTLLIGWFTDNELAWFPDTLFAFHISQPASSETRRALVQLLRRKYSNSFEKLQRDFTAEDAANFDELTQGGKLRLRDGGKGMLVADSFMRMVARQFYKVAHDAIRAVDKNHLILGDRYHGYCPDAVAEAIGPYVDVVSTNFDQPDWTDGALPAFYLERLHQLTNRPILITEYYAASRDNRSGNRNTGNIFTTVATQKQRGDVVRKRLTHFASLPYVVGAHWFQYTDEPTHGRHDGEDYNFGLVDIADRPYDEVVSAFVDAHAQVPSLHAESARHGAASSPFVVPMAPADPLAGIAAWNNESRSQVPCLERLPQGDLMATWSKDSLCLALGCTTFVDAAAYDAAPVSDSNCLVWQIALGDAPPVEVRFGLGDTMAVSAPDVQRRLHRHGMRYTAMIAIPAGQLGKSSLAAGENLRLKSTLIDPRRGTVTTWTPQLKLGGPLREALSQQEPATR